ncbi:hypothetical protein ACXXNA_21435 [Bordetella bronchiseptica]
MKRLLILAILAIAALTGGCASEPGAGRPASSMPDDTGGGGGGGGGGGY